MSGMVDKAKEAIARLKWRWDSLEQGGQSRAKLIGAGAIGGVALLILLATQVLPALRGSLGGGQRVADPTAFADLDYLSTRTRDDLEAELKNRRERLAKLVREQGESGEYVEAARRAVERVEQAISRVGGVSSGGGPAGGGA